MGEREEGVIWRCFGGWVAMEDEWHDLDDHLFVGRHGLLEDVSSVAIHTTPSPVANRRSDSTKKGDDEQGENCGDVQDLEECGDDRGNASCDADAGPGGLL